MSGRRSGGHQVLLAVYALFTLAAGARSIIQLATRADEAPLAYSLSLGAALTYALGWLAIRRAAEVWIVTAGEAKAAAVARALSGAGEVAIPVAGAQGRQRTRWLLDRAAAAELPRDLAPAVG